MKEKYSWQFKLLILCMTITTIITYGSFAIVIQTDDILFTIIMIIGLAVMVSGIKIITMIPIKIMEEG